MHDGGGGFSGGHDGGGHHGGGHHVGHHVGGHLDGQHHHHHGAQDRLEIQQNFGRVGRVGTGRFGVAVAVFAVMMIFLVLAIHR